MSFAVDAAQQRGLTRQGEALPNSSGIASIHGAQYNICGSDFGALARRSPATIVPKSTLYRVSFLNQGEVYEVYARSVRSSDIFGFVELADFVFGERSSVVIDPGEDKLQREFDGVNASLIPMHSVVRIDVVDKSGTAKVTPAGDGSKVTQLPIYTQRGPSNS